MPNGRHCSLELDMPTDRKQYPNSPPPSGWRAHGSTRARRAIEACGLAIGAPVGWLLIRFIQGVGPVSALGSNPVLYLYLFGATATAFAMFGFIIGTHEDHLVELMALLATDALTDVLTGLPNRRYFDQRLMEEWAISGRLGTVLALGMFDIDHFKVVNDRFGHPTGDRLLQAIAAAMSGVLRAGEVLARVGGEEFAVLFLGDGATMGASACDRLRTAAAAVRISTPAGEDIGVTVTAGVATSADASVISSDALYAAADRMLYRGKREGRNRVAAATALARSLERVNAPSPPR